MPDEDVVPEYMLLTNDDKVRLLHIRIRELEATHFAMHIRLTENIHDLQAQQTVMDAEGRLDTVKKMLSDIEAPAVVPATD